jgi:antitoxin component YwqK of YwqJK toxin-antitoxin module
MNKNENVVYYSGTDGKIIRTDHTFIEYDKGGEIIRKTEYDYGCPKEIREYDPNGRVWLIRKLMPGMIDPGPDDLYESCYMQYFPDGKIKRQVTTHYDKGIMSYYEIGIEDRDNAIWIESVYDKNGTPDSISIYSESDASIKSVIVNKSDDEKSIQYNMDDLCCF